MNYGVLAHWKNNSPLTSRKQGIVEEGCAWLKIISSAKNEIFLVELEHLWEFTSINVKGKSENKGEGNFKIIVVTTEVLSEKKQTFFFQTFSQIR